MDGNILAVIGANLVAVAFGSGIVYQKLNSVCKTLDSHLKNHPGCSVHTQVEADIAVLKSKVK